MEYALNKRHVKLVETGLDVGNEGFTKLVHVLLISVFFSPRLFSLLANVKSCSAYLDFAVITFTT